MLLEQRKVLVLNKSWQAINIIPLESAIKKLCTPYKNGEPKARIIDCLNDFQTMTWFDWSQIHPRSDLCSKCKRILDKDQIIDNKCKVCDIQMGEEGIKSSKDIFRIPTVIQLTRYDKLPTPKIHYNRRAIYKRDNYQCQYCGKKGENIDHVIPKSHGGKTDWTNVVLSCVNCNARKGARTPEEANMKLLKQPKKPKYNLGFDGVIIKDWENFISEIYWNVSIL